MYVATLQRWLVHQNQSEKRSTEYGNEEIVVFVIFGTNIMVIASIFAGIWFQQRQVVIVWLVYHALALITKIAYTAYSSIDVKTVFLTTAFLIEIPCWLIVLFYCIKARSAFVAFNTNLH